MRYASHTTVRTGLVYNGSLSIMQSLFTPGVASLSTWKRLNVQFFAGCKSSTFFSAAFLQLLLPPLSSPFVSDKHRDLPPYDKWPSLCRCCIYLLPGWKGRLYKRGWALFVYARDSLKVYLRYIQVR